MKKLFLLSLMASQAMFAFDSVEKPKDLGTVAWLNEDIGKLKEEADTLTALPEKTPEQEARIPELQKKLNELRDQRNEILDQFLM